MTRSLVWACTNVKLEKTEEPNSAPVKLDSVFFNSSPDEDDVIMSHLRKMSRAQLRALISRASSEREPKFLEHVLSVDNRQSTAATASQMNSYVSKILTP